MAKLHLKSIRLSWILLILFTFISETFECARHGNSNSRQHKPKHNFRYHFNDWRYREFVPSHRKHGTISPAEKILIPEYELRFPKTSCGNTLCINIPNYPTTKINRAVDGARNILRSGETITAFQNKGISYHNFVSQYDSFWFGERAPDHRFIDETNDCKEHVNTMYPHEGYSYDDEKIYYIVNVPTMYRGLTSMLCESNDQMCIKINDVLSATNRSCRQMYRDEQLLALPSGKDYFDVEDFVLKTFYVPTGCFCIPSP